MARHHVSNGRLMMRVFIECDGLVEVLSRTLDLIRRMGIGIAAVGGWSNGRATSLELLVNDPAAPALSTLRERITLIEGVRSVFLDDGSGQPPQGVATWAHSAGADCHREG